MRHHQLGLEQIQRLLRSDLAHLQLGVGVGADRTLLARPKCHQLSVGWLVGIHHPLGVKTPAFGIDGVEREVRPRNGDAVLDHVVELQFVSGTRFMSG